MPPSPPRPSALRRLDAALSRPLRRGGRQLWAPLLLVAVLVLLGSGATVVHGVVRTQLAETAAEAPQPEAAATPAPDTAPDDAAADVPADVPAEAVAETAATDPPAAESAAETEPAVSSSAPAPAPAPTPAPCRHRPRPRHLRPRPPPAPSSGCSTW
ncbi:hypothetical protein JD78_02820 [Modestobacter roseus]|uniref:Uncharacterized protein n=1 Tax=Modestobacter roseus TaxID=1181884 RepID=A0A562IUC9_9ACTN|nr:hypothetical protein [Modestobacter roseus]TWH74285.1 hypothetical protein JD78_02820 [Modestobacter roseus]